MRGVLLQLLAGLFLTASCATVSPEIHREKLNMGKRLCRSIIYNLESYKASTGTYPQSLMELPEDERKNLPLSIYGHDVDYKKISDKKYNLSFKFVSYGLNVCEYENSTTAWRCDGWNMQ